MASVGDMTVNITVDTRQFEREIKRAERIVRDATKRMMEGIRVIEIPATPKRRVKR